MEYTITLDYISYLKSYEELTNYLLSIKGIIDVKITELSDLINVDVKYNSEFINDERIRLEILAFLKLLNYPCIYGYDKHYKEDVVVEKIEYQSCCEFCFANIIYTLIDIDAISKVESNFHENYWHGSKEKYYIKIYYNPKILTKEKYQKLRKEIDCYG